MHNYSDGYSISESQSLPSIEKSHAYLTLKIVLKFNLRKCKFVKISASKIACTASTNTPPDSISKSLIKKKIVLL